jgi:NAD(P)H-dependent FMN reductase
VKYIISGTNRPGSRSRQVSTLIQKIYVDLAEQVEIIDLAELPYADLTGAHYAGGASDLWTAAINKVNSASGLIFVVPEYNGSFPGALKYFIDHWKYPESFEYRPVCFVGLGGLFGGLRPVEQLQQVMGYRNAFQYPERIFLTNIFKTLKAGELDDPVALPLLKSQAKGFQAFVKALESQSLDANSKRQKKT